MNDGFLFLALKLFYEHWRGVYERTGEVYERWRRVYERDGRVYERIAHFYERAR